MAKIRVRKRGKTYSYSFDISKKPRKMKEKGGFATEQEAFDAGTAAYAAWKTGNVGITSAKVTLDESSLCRGLRTSSKGAQNSERTISMNTNTGYTYPHTLGRCHCRIYVPETLIAQFTN